MTLALRILELAARLVLALGIGCLLLGCWLASRTLTFERGAVRTTGEVVSQHEVRDGDAVRYRPVVRFRGEGGEIYKFMGQLATSSPRFAVGTRLPVVYRPAEPGKARISTFTDNWLGPVVSLVLGAIAITGGWFIRRSVRREAAKFAART